jgi:hypothetical protein
MAVSSLLQVSYMRRQTVCHTKLNHLLCGKSVHQHMGIQTLPVAEIHNLVSWFRIHVPW